MKISKISTGIYGNRKRLLIKLSFSRLKGALTCAGKTGGFVLGIDNAPAFSISSVKAMDDSLYIYTTAGYNSISGIDCCELAYQPTDDEYTADSNGRLEPLNPFPLYDRGNYSPYCHCGYISEIKPLKKNWSSIGTADIPNDDEFRPFVCNHNVIMPRVLNNHRRYDDNSIVFIRFCFECHSDMELDLLWGCSGKLKVSIDGEKMKSHKSPQLLFATLIQRVCWKKGTHTVDAAFCNTLTERGDKGITLKLRSCDPDGELPELIRDENAKYFFNV